MAQVAGGGAAALITALNSQKTVKSTLNLKKSVEGLNKAEENGALPDFRNMMESMVNTGPAASALSVFGSYLQRETVGSNVQLLKDTVELLGSEVGQAGIGILANLINNVVDQADTYVRIGNVFSDIPGISAFSEALGKINDVFHTLGSPAGPLFAMINFLLDMKDAMQGIGDETKSGADKFNDFMDQMGLFGDIVQKISGWIRDILGMNDSGTEPDFSYSALGHPGIY